MSTTYFLCATNPTTPKIKQKKYAHAQNTQLKGNNIHKFFNVFSLKYFLLVLLVGTGSLFLLIGSVPPTSTSYIHNTKNFGNEENVLQLTTTVIAKYKKPIRFTQGLILVDNCIYESSGLYGKSNLSVYRYNKNSKKNSFNLPLVTTFKLPGKYFAEGITWVNDKFFLLTWLEKTAFLFEHQCPQSNNIAPFKQLGKVPYPEEGWGITAISGNYLPRTLLPPSSPLSPLSSLSSSEKITSKNNSSNKTLLITSNGTSTLTWRDVNFKEVTRMNVTIKGKSVSLLNELETAPFPHYASHITKSIKANKIQHKNSQVEHFVYANIWGSDFIAIISPVGKVIAEIDLRSISAENKPTATVQKKTGVLNGNSDLLALEYALNGIAYLGASEFLITGKNWKNFYRVKFTEK